MPDSALSFLVWLAGFGCAITAEACNTCPSCGEPAGVCECG
jgi:hypothetical protein